MKRNFIVKVTTDDKWEHQPAAYIVNADSEMEARIEVERWIPETYKVISVEEWRGGVKLISEACPL